MSWRIVMVTSSSKISVENKYIVIESDETRKVYVEEIDVLLIENTATTITVPAINMLARHNVNVIYCDKAHTPYAFSSPIYGNHLQSKNLLQQINWSAESKNAVWMKIVEAKIRNQYITLKKFYPESPKLSVIEDNLNKVKDGDVTNREGMVAKVYFKEMFGKGFVRTDDDVTNSVLNYAYAVLAASFSRIIVSRGYLTDMGIHHKNVFNHFNFTYDLLEPYRPIIDYYITQLVDFDKVDSNMKKRILLIFNNKVIVGGKKHYFNNSIEVYFSSVLDALNGKGNEIKFPLLEYSEL